MNEFKGTPGPWVIGGNEGSKLSVNADPYFVALVDEGYSQEANARLIAAAPELLEALQIICFFEDISSAQREIAEAAIAKALGESQ